MDGDFRSTALTASEISRGLHYNFLSSPVPFEYSDSVLSPSSLHAINSNSRLCNPSPFQQRVPTPYPVGIASAECITSGKEWPGTSLDNKVFPPSWGHEPAVQTSQPFTGTLLPVHSNNSHTIHQYAFPQTWHHAIATQNISGYNPYGNDSWCGEFSVIDGLSTFEEGGEAIEQDSRVTSSTEVSPWKPLQLVLPPVSEFLNSTRSLNTKNFHENSSPTEKLPEQNVDIKSKHGMFNHESTTSNHEHCLEKKEVKTQTPWKLKKARQQSQIQPSRRENIKPERRTNPQAYLQQKVVQREREKAIRLQLKELGAMLPWTHLQNTCPSRKGILEGAISHINQLQEKVRQARHQERKRMEDLTGTQESKELYSHSDGCCDYTTSELNSSEISDELRNISATPATTPLQNVPEISMSPSELSSPALEEAEDSFSQTLQDSHSESTANHIKRPMNAFLLFSQQYRKVLKSLHPGRDNRKISTLLAEHWRKLEPEGRQPYKEKAKELMRRTKETHPNFKYCDTRRDSSVTMAMSGDRKQGNCNQGYKIGSHNLRQRTDSKSKRRKATDQPDTQARAYKEYKPRTMGKKDTRRRKQSDTIKTPRETKLQHKPVKTEPLRRDGSVEPSPVGNTEKESIHWTQRTCDVWAQCEGCKKWHMLPDNTDPTSLPDKWYCWMNADNENKPCSGNDDKPNPMP